MQNAVRGRSENENEEDRLAFPIFEQDGESRGKKLEAEAQTKFDLPRTVDLRADSEWSAGDRAKIGRVLQVQVWIVEPRVVHYV